jgi:hypothetical protein
MTRFQDTKDKLRIAYRMTLRRQCGEYRVNFRDGAEATAYYTTDLEDAFATAVAMRERVGHLRDQVQS